MPDYPEPQAIDPASGFKVPHRNLVRQWDGEWIDRRFVDKRNPQDMVRSRARAEGAPLPHPRPEPEDVFIATNVLDDEGRPVIDDEGNPVLTDGRRYGEGI